MVAKKRKSKRTTLQQKYKIQKRTKEHHRKVAKGKVRVANYGQRSKKVKDHIPNAWPYKEELLKEIAAAKEKMEAMKQRKKEAHAEEQARRRMGGMRVEMEHDEAMDEDAMQQDRDMNEKEEQDEGQDLYTKDGGQNSRRAFLSALRKVVDQADVILHVLDARDPEGTKSTVIENMVFSNHKKKLVYVLNKSDLVPKEVLAGWLRHLRQSCPAIPFKSNTQSQGRNLGRAGGRVSTSSDTSTDSSLRTSQAVGADELVGLLKNYARIGKDSSTKATIAVGIVGFPNVGKSSLINSLMRVRAVGVSSTPGFTTSVSEVILDKNIRLLDSPGIVFAAGSGSTTALRNCLNVETMEDVITPIQAILERCPQHYLMQLYAIPRFKEQDALSFLALVARSQGKLRKGGVPNTDAAARTVLHDWNSGKIKFYCKPPVVETMSSSSTSRIVSGFSDEFDVDALLQVDSKILGLLEQTGDDDNDEYVAVEDAGSTMQETDSEDEDMSSKKTSKSKLKSKNKADITLASSSKKVNKVKTASSYKKVATKAAAKVPRKVSQKAKSTKSKVAYDFNEHFGK